MALEQGLVCCDGGDAHRRARDIHQQIVNDDNGEQPPLFAKVILFQEMSEPSTLEGQGAHEELRTLFVCATV